MKSHIKKYIINYLQQRCGLLIGGYKYAIRSSMHSLIQNIILSFMYSNFV